MTLVYNKRLNQRSMNAHNCNKSNMIKMRIYVIFLYFFHDKTFNSGSINEGFN